MAGSFQIYETKASIDAHAEDDWEPEWMSHRFTGMLRCTRPQCGDTIAVAGDSVSEEYYEPHPANPHDYIAHGVETRLRAKYVLPAPTLFRLPPNTPEPVRREIIGAFSLFWTDSGACAGRLRSALEALMDYFKIPRTFLNAQKKRRRIDLHRRIEHFRPRAPGVADHLLAAKWIGNAGAHAAQLTESDLFDAMDLIEEALDELIAKRTSGLRRIAKSITTRKRPRGQ